MTKIRDLFPIEEIVYKEGGELNRNNKKFLTIDHRKSYSQLGHSHAKKIEQQIVGTILSNAELNKLLSRYKIQLKYLEFIFYDNNKAELELNTKPEFKFIEKNKRELKEKDKLVILKILFC